MKIFHKEVLSEWAIVVSRKLDYDVIPPFTYRDILLTHSGFMLSILIAFIFFVFLLIVLKTKNKQLNKKSDDYEELQKLAHIGHWELDHEKNTLEWSDEVFEIFELDKNSFTPSLEAFYSSIFQEDIASVQSAFKNSLKNKNDYNINHRLIMPDGRIKQVVERGSTQYDNFGNPIFTQGTIQNITKEKKIQEELFHRQKQLEIAAQISGLAFWELDLKTNIFTFNDLYYKFLDTDAETEGGYSMDVAHYFASFIPPESQKIVIDVIGAAFGKSEDYVGSFEYNMLSRSGKMKDVLVDYYISYDKDAKPDKSYGTKYDLTERKRKEQELITLHNKTRELFSEQKILLSLFDKGDSVLFKWNNDELWSTEYVSQSVEKLTGYSVEDFTSHKITYDSCIHPDDISHVLEEVNEALEQNKDFFRHDSYRLLTKENQEKWLLDYTVMQKDTNGKVSHFIGYITDITDSKQKEIELENARKIADEANKAKSAFLSNMSHEIRTPLNGIIGLTELALKTDMTPLQRDYLDKSISSSQMLLSIINDILDYSKIEANKIELEAIEFRLDTMLRELSDLFVYKMQEQKINFHCEIAPTVHQPLIGDPFRIKQVLINLIGNAIKFTKEGEISVHVHLLENSSESYKIKFNVKDSGIGISKKRLNKLFKPFSQVDSSDTREFGGTGLGLSISKRLVKLMGGEIGVFSKEGEGSEFYFTVRLKSLQEGKVLQKTTFVREIESVHRFEDNENFRLRGKILLVEDNEINQIVAEQNFKNYGLEVEIANNGKIAVKMAKETHYNMIFMDLQMPVMDGLEATKHIREFNKDIPIIALSAAVMEADKKSTLQAGMNEHIAKPIDLKILQTILQKYLQRSSSSVDNP